MLYTSFHRQNNSSIERQNSIMKPYVQVFVNYKQNNLVKSLFLAEFFDKKAKNTSTSHTPFELNCNYYPRIFFQEKINPCFQLK